MTIRLLITGLFGLSVTLVGTDIQAPLTTNEAEACGVKVAVKAAPPKRNLARAATRSRPIDRGDSRVAVRTRIDTKSDRTPIAAGQDRQARAATPKRAATEPTLRTSKTPKPAPKRKPERIAKVEPETEPEIAPDPEPTADPDPTPAPATEATGAELFFETGESGLPSGAESELQEIVDWLKANPKGKVIIEGHTDPVGSTARNQQLSVKRGKAVQAYLSSAAGVPATRFQVKGYGETRLHYPRNSPKNRRVVIKTR